MDIGISKHTFLSSILVNRKHALFSWVDRREYLTSESFYLFAGNNQHNYQRQLLRHG